MPPQVDQTQLRQAFTELGHPEVIVQRAGDGDFLVRARPFENVTTATADAPSQLTEREVVIAGLQQRFGAVEVLGFDFVSPLIAAEIVRYAFLAVAAACVGILLYLWFAFRKVPHAWRYGSCAVFALVHDTLLVLGVMSILGRLFGIELDSLFITAILTVIGFSVHDTIVVFDRVRENIIRHQGEPFESVVNHSLAQTLVRSINTSITVVLTLVALRLFGGVTIHTFVLALLIGMISGTYSSIFNASLLLVSWENGELGRLWRRLTFRPSEATA
jgi:preprotein translocase subunit SecF